MFKESMTPLPQFISSPRGRHFLESAYILLLPVAVWFIYRFSTFNDNDGFLDSWVYFGYIHNFQDLIDRYGLPYYSVRFGLIFPNILLVKIFGPIKGYLAFVYLMYLLAGIPLYLLFRKLYSVHAAVLAYAILVSSAWFARTVLWTHPDATAVPYLIAALALMFLDLRHRRVANFAIGALVASAVNSNFFALSIGGLISVAYLSYFKNDLWSRIRQDTPWIIGGFALVFVAGSLGYYACCDHLNYFTSTLDMVKWGNSGQGAAYQPPLMDFLKVNHIYLPPFLIILMYVASKYQKFKTDRLWSACTYYLVTVIAFEFWYRFAIPSALLETFYYFSFLLVPCISCIVLILIMLARAGNSETYLLNLAIASFLLPPLIIAYWVPWFFSGLATGWVLLGFAVMPFFVLLTSRFRNAAPYAIVFFVSLLQASLFSSTVNGVNIYAQMYGRVDGWGTFGNPAEGLARFRLGLKFIKAMPKFKEDRRPIYFWYSNSDQVANSLQSTYLWGYSRLFDSAKETKGLPSLKGVNVDLLQKQEKSSLVLFDRDKRNVNLGIEELRRVGLPFSIKKTDEICEQTLCYAIVVLDVNGLLPLQIKQNWREVMRHPLSVALDWGQPGAGAKIEQSGTVISIVTHPKAWNYGAVASMVFSEKPPAKHGVVRILVSVREASAGLGFTGSNISNFIKRVEVLPKDEPQELFFEIDNLSELRHFVVSTWDQDKSAKVEILKFELAEVPQNTTGQ